MEQLSLFDEEPRPPRRRTLTDFITAMVLGIIGVGAGITAVGFAVCMASIGALFSALPAYGFVWIWNKWLCSPLGLRPFSSTFHAVVVVVVLTIARDVIGGATRRKKG